MENLNLLLTSVGRRSYLVEYFKEALAGRGLVHAANSSADSPAFMVADRSVVTPLIYDEGYIDFLLRYCRENDIKAIISLFDVDLPVLAGNKARFEQAGVKLIVSDPSVINICNDKWNTYLFLKDAGLNAPETYTDPDEALRAIREGALHFPLIVKPRWGMGSIGILEADNEEELFCFFRKERKIIGNSYLKYESEQTLEKCVLIQQKLKGQEYGLDVMNDLEGSYVNTSVKLKYAMRSGETDCAITVDEPRLAELGGRLSAALRHVANLDVDVFMVDGRAYILEMNARFGGGYPFSHVAGVDLPGAIVRWLMGRQVPAEMLVPRPGVKTQKDIRLTILNQQI